LQISKLGLFNTIVRSDLAALKHSLSLKGVDIENRDHVGRTPLHLAILTASSDICQCLLEHGAHVGALTEQEETTVHLAAKRGDVSILQTIMQAIEAKQAAAQHETNPGEQTLDVNCLSGKHKMSPLYIAVALGMS
jgi:ankyrin repeat protein